MVVNSPGLHDTPDFNYLNEFVHINKTSVYVELDLKYLVCTADKFAVFWLIVCRMREMFGYETLAMTPLSSWQEYGEWKESCLSPRKYAKSQIHLDKTLGCRWHLQMIARTEVQDLTIESKYFGLQNSSCMGHTFSWEQVDSLLKLSVNGWWC